MSNLVPLMWFITALFAIFIITIIVFTANLFHMRMTMFRFNEDANGVVDLTGIQLETPNV